MAYIAHSVKNVGVTLNHENFRDHERFITKIYFNANLEICTKFLNDKILEL